jgi:hypothetical protein
MSTGQPGFVGGGRRSRCNEISGGFQVLQIAYDQVGAPASTRSLSNTAKAYSRASGQIRYNATNVPLYLMVRPYIQAAGTAVAHSRSRPPIRNRVGCT